MDTNDFYYIPRMLGHTSLITHNCTDDNSIHWLWNSFHECITNGVQLTGFILGLLSIFCWFIVYFPQFYESYKNGKMDEGISLFFLILWLLGDATNLLGCLLSNQLTTQVGTAYYYIAMDFLIISQYAYYYFKNRKQKARTANRYSPINSQPGQVVFCVAIVMWFSSVLTISSSHMGPVPSRSRLPGRTLLSDSDCKTYLDDTRCLFYSDEDIIGYVCGVLSSVFYLASRTPQIYMNYKRKSVEGISRMMFVIAILANLLYGAAVLFEVNGDAGVFIIRHLPWLVGSLGTLAFDFTVVVQFRVYKMAKPDSGPLMSEDTDPLPINAQYITNANSDMI